MFQLSLDARVVRRTLALGVTAVAAMSAGPVAAADAQAPTCRGLTATIVGNDSANRITGTAQRDIIQAGAGNDHIDGGGGDDVICGSTGDDRVVGGGGVDTLDGGAGVDACFWSSAETPIFCEPGTATSFMPTRHGFPFVNRFTVDPSFDTPFGRVGLQQLEYGLCGGMVFAALDTWQIDDVAPGTATTPQSGVIFDYLFSRLVDSLAIDWGHNFWRFNDLQGKSNSQLQSISSSEFDAMRPVLNAGTPVPVGVVIAQPGQPVWGNHQVLAIGWFTSGTNQILKVYDPNRPDVISYLNITQMTIADPAAPTSATPIRGIFAERYSRRTPPWA